MKQQNPMLEVLVTVALPALILVKLSQPERLGPLYAFFLALSFPFFYSLWNLIKEKKLNLIAILGFFNVLLSGGLGLLQAEGTWFAIKEASVPLTIAGVVWVSLKKEDSIVRSILMNDAIIDLPAVEKNLPQSEFRAAFHNAVVKAGKWLTVSFLLSAVLNFTLAKVLLLSPPGTVEFNQELGKMTALSYPVISLPCLVIMVVAAYRFRNEVQNILKQTNSTSSETRPSATT